MKKAMGNDSLIIIRNLFFCEKAEMRLLDEKTLKLFISEYSENEILVGGT